MTIRKIIVLPVVSVAIVAIVVTTALASGSSTAVRTASARSQARHRQLALVESSRAAVARASHREISRQLLQHFVIVRRALRQAKIASSSVALPTPIGASLSQGPLGSNLGINPSLASYVKEDASTGVSGLWVIPGTSGICLMIQDSASTTIGGTCGTVARADAGMLSIVRTTPAGVRSRVSLIPDTGNSVSVTPDSGNPVSVTPHP